MKKGEMARSDSIIGPSVDSQQNVFNVQYLGRLPMSNFSTGEGVLQSALFEMYTKFKTKKGTKKLSNAKIVLSNRGLSVVNWTNDEEFYSIPNVVVCKAVVFTGSKTKVSGTKYYKFAFERLPDIGRGSVMSTAMPKTFKYLLKMKHQPLVVCILRRDLGPKILEIHAFVCISNDQALGLSYSIEMARSIQLNEEKKISRVFDYDHYFSTQGQNQVPVGNISMPDSQGNEADLPQVMDMLKHLGGGRGSVVNQVVKTPNLNLMTDNIFVPNNLKMNKSQQNKMSVSARGQDRQSRIYQLNQEDFLKPAQRPSPRTGHNRSSSYNQLNDLSSFQQAADFKFIQQPKPSAKNPPQIQRSRSLKNPDQDLVPQNRVDLPQNLVSNNPSGAKTPGADKPNRPVAMVQPRKLSGIKVFPFGHDRTGLIPDKDKLKKKKVTEESKGSSPPQTPELANLYSQVNKQVSKNPRSTFIMKANTEEQLKKMMQDVTLECRK